jgi:hypothetical protein
VDYLPGAVALEENIPFFYESRNCFFREIVGRRTIRSETDAKTVKNCNGFITNGHF